MYDELITSLRTCIKCSSCKGCKFDEEVDESDLIGGELAEPDCMGRLMAEAADAIEDLAAFKEQITDGHMYCMKDGILYRVTVNPPKGKSIKLPPIKYAEPPRESES